MSPAGRPDPIDPEDVLTLREAAIAALMAAGAIGLGLAFALAFALWLL